MCLILINPSELKHHFCLDLSLNKKRFKNSFCGNKVSGHVDSKADELSDDD